jgi:hypothetical protein
MDETRKWRGGVVISDDRHSHGLIELLAAPVRDRIDLVYYDHPYNIETDPAFDFVIVFSLDNVRGVIKLYDSKRCSLPLLVHVDSPVVIRGLRHDRLYPGVRILPIPQAPLSDEPGVTLEINMFAQILELLRQQGATS